MEPTDKEINDKLRIISSKYPMSAEGFKVVELIGTGMNSNKVFLAECLTQNNEKVAIKQIDLSQQSKETKEKITKEVMGMSIMTSSEYVVQFHCSFVHGETLWIVMDLQEGSIRDVIKWKYKSGIDNESIIASIAYQTLKGLNFLHGLRIIHRDIKTGNRLFNIEGKIKLADFGVSAILASHDEKRQTMAGTWHWMAPEVIDPSEYGGYDFKADIWSLGITCIELAYGVAPYFDVRPNKVIVYILQNSPPSLDDPRISSSTEIKRYSSTFKEFVTRCLQQDPHKRPSAENMLNHKFFKELPQTAQMKEALTDNLPSLGERFKIQEDQKRGLRLAQAKDMGLGQRIASNRSLASGGLRDSRKSPRVDKDDG